MSRNKWLVVGLLAIGNLVVIGLLAVVVLRGLPRSAAPAAPAPTASPILALTPTLAPTPTPPATWTPTASPTPASTRTPAPTAAPTGTATPWPTFTPSATPTPAPVDLENPTFEGIQENLVPGWQTGAFVNWAPGQEFDPVTSYAVPRFHQADDPRQWIDGPTLQIDTAPWVKLRAWVFQTVELAPGSRVRFQVLAVGFVKDLAGGYILKAGIDPSGGAGCDAARWGAERLANQRDGAVELTSPEVRAGPEGRVTVCVFAETQFAQVYHAAFIDDAVLKALPPVSQ